MEIALKPEHQKILEEWVEAGKYASVAEAVEAALENQARCQAAIEDERRLVQHAIDQSNRGESRTLSGREELAKFGEEIKRRSQARSVE